MLWHLAVPLVVDTLSLLSFIFDSIIGTDKKNTTFFLILLFTTFYITFVTLKNKMKPGRNMKCICHASQATLAVTQSSQTHTGANWFPIVRSFLWYLETTFVQIKLPARAVIYTAAHYMTGIMSPRSTSVRMHVKIIQDVWLVPSRSTMFWTQLI